MFPGREFLGNPPRREMERYFYAGRTSKARLPDPNLTTESPSLDDGKSPGV